MKILLKRKTKRNLCIFSVPYHGVPYPLCEVHIFTRSYDKASSNFGDYVTKWNVDNSSQDFFNFHNIALSLILEKTFFWRVIVSVNRLSKDIKVTFLSFGLHTGRFTVECTEYGSTLFSYFEIFIYVSSNFTLDWRITEYLRCHIGL